MISARIIADSKNGFGNRLTTFVLVIPRILLSEFNTHRAISRNSASSRAIPFEKMLKSVEENPFIPLKWQKDHSGMQGTEYFTHSKEIDILNGKWLNARDAAIKSAKDLNKELIYSEDSYSCSTCTGVGVTKQLCNRLLEPFLYHTVIATATEWGNFFALRAHKDAEIHIQDLAYKMLDAYNDSNPVLLEPGEWHIPFGDNINLPPTIPIEEGLTLDEGVAIRKVMVATARCARVSYNNFEGKDDYNADIKLYHRLLESGHLSPFEHCAQAMNLDLEDSDWSGNFQGFIQLRKTIEGENKSDSRIIVK